MSIDEVGQIEDLPIGVIEGEIEDASAFRRPPDAGTYTLVRVEDDADRDFRSGIFTYEGKGHFWANIVTKVQGGPFDGAVVRGGFNTMTKIGANGTTAHDYLKANGSSARPTSKVEWEKETRKYFGPFKAQINWEWTCQDGDEYVTFLTTQGGKVPKKFKRLYPTANVVVQKDANGKVSHVQLNPFTGEEVGARAVITLYLPKGVAGKTVTVPATATVASEG